MLQFIRRIIGRATREDKDPSATVQVSERAPDLGASRGDYSGDQPISHRAQDRFNRWPFAERIARTLAERGDPSSVVIGIYGAWGDGKTSTLRLMEEALGQHGNVVLAKFNPWQFESQEQLLRGFFATLAERLGKSLPTKMEELGSILQRYGKLLSIASVGIAGGAVQITPGAAVAGVGEALSAVELEELRRRLERILKESGKRVVVFIDDIDRLDRTEIQAIFKLVKLSASFDYTSYVLAFDDEMVAAALGERYGAGGSESGRAFLEKIVQVPLHLPPADELALRRLAFDGVETALKLSEIELTTSQVEAFVRHFVDGLEPRLSTPRQARLYGNVLAFALPILKDEVNPVDQMLIEGIRVFYPKLYVGIRDHREFFFTRRREGAGDEDTRRRARELIDAALAGTGVDRDRVVHQLLQVLFPRLQTLLGNTTYGPEWDLRWDREQRVCSDQYFDRYFRYAVPPGDVPDVQVIALLDTAMRGTEEATRDGVRALAGRERMQRLIGKLRRREEEITEPAARHLAMAVAQEGGAIPRERQMLLSDWTLSQGGILVMKLVKQVPPGSAREDLARRVIREAEPLAFAVECFRWLRRRKEEPETERVVGPEVEQELSAILAARVAASAATAPLYRVHGEDAPRLLWIWREYGPLGEVGRYLTGRFEANPAEVDEFLDVYVGRVWGVESGLSHRSDFDRDAYNVVASLIDPERLYQILRGRYDGLEDAEYHRGGEVPLNRRIAEQFTVVHRRAREEGNRGGVPPPAASG